MSDPQTAVANQLRNIEARTGKTIEQLSRLIADSGLTKVGEQRTFLMQTLGLGYGDANALAMRAREAAAPPAGTDPLDAIYAGGKAPLRALHEQVIAAFETIGSFEKSAKKTYVSMRRKKQFAMLGPVTKDALELGLNIKHLPSSVRHKALPPGGMCQYSVRLRAPSDIDAELLNWVKSAYEAAG